ncbi:MAG: methyltransferase domain-containing protein [Vannielia sp.]|uniref:methyltransferase domain-containing protein n=1 Tax=Vannielia sp. TaxID=2813045 RepID=UPI003B8D5FE8
MTGPDWNPALYARFAGLRLRPALDLLLQVRDLPEGDIIDLGCGNGAVGPVLKARFPDRHLQGIDTSPAMLAEARDTGCYDSLNEADAAVWAPTRPPALIFSNAALQWLPDHATLFPRLLALLAPGGTLAIQMPRQHNGPSHALIRTTAKALFPERFAAPWREPVDPPTTYARLMAPLGETSVWETDYIQRLDPVETGHPVRHFTQSTFMRPFTEGLTAEEEARFLEAYEAELQTDYPTEDDGSVLFPFRRVFLTVRRES